MCFQSISDLTPLSLMALQLLFGFSQKWQLIFGSFSDQVYAVLNYLKFCCTNSERADKLHSYPRNDIYSTPSDSDQMSSMPPICLNKYIDFWLDKRPGTHIKINKLTHLHRHVHVYINIYTIYRLYALWEAMERECCLNLPLATCHLRLHPALHLRLWHCPKTTLKFSALQRQNCCWHKSKCLTHNPI